jgi:hypothetical protein
MTRFIILAENIALGPKVVSVLAAATGPVFLATEKYKHKVHHGRNLAPPLFNTLFNKHPLSHASGTHL